MTLRLEPDHHDHPALDQPGHGEHHGDDARRHQRRVLGRSVHLHGERDIGRTGHHERGRHHLLCRRPGLFDVTTTATPSVSSISDTAFSGCTPSVLPAGISLIYTGGSTASLEGTPVDGQGGAYTVCLVASNGVAPPATQDFTLTIDAPAAHHHHHHRHHHHPLRHRHTATGWSAPTAASSPSGRPSSTARPAPCTCSVPSSASRRRPTGAATGWWPPTVGIFAFGDAGFHGSIPGAGLHPAGSGQPTA